VSFIEDGFGAYSSLLLPSGVMSSDALIMTVGILFMLSNYV